MDMSGMEGGATGSPLFRFLRQARDRVRARRRPQGIVSRSYSKWLDTETRAAALTDGPRISILMPVYMPPLPFLQAAILSVKKQTYRNWELCIVDDASPARSVGLMIVDMAGQEIRIKSERLKANAGIAVATNAALAMATGDFVALLDHDDELAPQALSRVAAELAVHAEADLLFSDMDHLVNGRRRDPYFKPGWNPDLLLSQNFLAHLAVYRRSLIDWLGGMRAEFAGSQDHDLALRAVAATPAGRIRHIPEVLYHWRQHGDSFSARRAVQSRMAAGAAVNAHLGGAGTAQRHPDLPQWMRIVFAVPEPEPAVSIVLPPGAPAPDTSGYGAVELCRGDAAAATGDVLVFLDKGLEPVGAGWLRELVSQVLRDGVGAAGARLDGPDRRIVQSGIILHPEHIAQTLAPRSDPDDPGYFGQFLLCRTVSAVAQAGMAVRREIFVELGGFDSRAGMFADVDFCLRLEARGLRCVWTPQARLRTRTRPRRRDDPAGALYMLQRWGERLRRDPYMNPNLAIRANTLGLVDRQAPPPQRPTHP